MHQAASTLTGRAAGRQRIANPMRPQSLAGLSPAGLPAGTRSGRGRPSQHSEQGGGPGGNPQPRTWGTPPHHATQKRPTPVHSGLSPSAAAHPRPLRPHNPHHAPRSSTDTTTTLEAPCRATQGPIRVNTNHADPSRQPGTRWVRGFWLMTNISPPPALSDVPPPVPAAVCERDAP